MSTAKARTMRAALAKVRALVVAEAWDRTHRLSRAVDLLTVLIEDGPQGLGTPPQRWPPKRRARR